MSTVLAATVIRWRRISWGKMRMAGPETSETEAWCLLRQLLMRWGIGWVKNCALAPDGFFCMPWKGNYWYESSSFPPKNSEREESIGLAFRPTACKIPWSIKARWQNEYNFSWCMDLQFDETLLFGQEIRSVTNIFQWSGKLNRSRWVQINIPREGKGAIFHCTGWQVCMQKKMETCNSEAMEWRLHQRNHSRGSGTKDWIGYPCHRHPHGRHRTPFVPGFPHRQSGTRPRNQGRGPRRDSSSCISFGRAKSHDLLLRSSASFPLEGYEPHKVTYGMERTVALENLNLTIAGE